VHAVGPHAGQREVEVAVGVHVRPSHAVAGVQQPQRRRRHVHEATSRLSVQDVGVRAATGDGAVHVQVQRAVVVPVREGACVPAGVHGDPPCGGRVREAIRLPLQEEPVRPVVREEHVEPPVAVHVLQARAYVHSNPRGHALGAAEWRLGDCRHPDLDFVRFHPQLNLFDLP